MLNRRTWGTCPIDCTEVLGNIYGNGSQICHPMSKTYRDTQLGELVHSITVEHASEHEVICERNPIGEKHREGETATGWQPPRASGCEAATSSWGDDLEWQKYRSKRNTKPSFLVRQISKWFYDTSTSTA
jgi:hypothetical protein